MTDDDIFEPYKKLVQIEILGKKREVPEKNLILRCFQYLSMESISYGDFCWNGDCANCQVWIKNGEQEKVLLACRAFVEENMQILRMSAEIELFDENNSKKTVSDL